MDDLTLITLTAAILQAGDPNHVTPQAAVEGAFVLRAIARQELAKRQKFPAGSVGREGAANA